MMLILSAVKMSQVSEQNARKKAAVNMIDKRKQVTFSFIKVHSWVSFGESERSLPALSENALWLLILATAPFPGKQIKQEPFSG